MSSRWASTVLFCGGGTGGHLYPGVAVADELGRQRPDLHIVFVGTKKGIEAEVLPRLGYPLETLDVAYVRGTGARGWLRGGMRLPLAALTAVRILRRHRPAVVVALGGYAAGPVTAVAAALRIPTALLEQNVVPGLTNRVLAPFVDRCLLGFDQARAHFRRSKSVVTGNPIRAELTRPLERAVGGAGLRILVTGGARGSRPINTHLPAVLHRIGETGVALHVRHQTGRAHDGDVRRRYTELGMNAEVVEYLPDIRESYRWADLVVARAGGSTLAELLVLGMPSVLVPFAGAADQHQLRNAEVLANAGAAVLVREDMLATGEAEQRMRALLVRPELIASMAENARRLGRPDAATRAAAEIRSMLEAS